jgi:glycosyltransferase involved in cell wall biosynthesis
MDKQAAPKVCVLMSVYNGERFLRETIESILNQTFTDFEFIIINDGSTDASSEILEEYAQKDSRIRLIHQENMGLTKSLNKGFGMAHGEYIARMDADDISEPTRFEKQVDFLDAHPSIGIVGINSYIIDERGNILREIKHPTSHDEIMSKILLDNKFIHSSVMLRKILLKKYGYYNEKLTYAQDYELFLRLSTHTKLANLPDPLHRWRENTSTGISVTKRPVQIVARDQIRMDFLEKHYALTKNHINLVLANFQNNLSDNILSQHLNKILQNISFMARLIVKLKIFLYYVRKIISF